jgi:acetyltransferase-like isoleucine patch superfamily enzyme
MIRSFTRLGPFTKIGKKVTVKCSAITGPFTDIGDGAFIGPQAIFFSDLSTGRSNTIVGAGAFIGGGARVMPGLNIGNRALIGAASFVNRDVLADKRVAGSPAKEVK